MRPTTPQTVINPLDGQPKVCVEFSHPFFIVRDRQLRNLLIRNAIHSVAELEIERYDVPG
jgi:hypothetical protein